MPLLDVSDILFDPDFADTMTVYRSTQTVGDDGIAVISTTSEDITGVVTAGKGDVLNRIAEGERISGSIMVHTTYRLTNGDGVTDADELVWNGQRYVVAVTSDYSRYGAGFIAAECHLKPLSP